MDFGYLRHRRRGAVHRRDHLPLILLALAACSAWSDVWAPAPTPPGGVLLYVSERTGLPVIHHIAPDGTRDRALPACPAAGYPGPPDPTGRAVLAVCTLGTTEADHVEQLRLAPLDGGTPIDLAAPARMIRNPAWAPDGSWIVFESDGASFRDLYRINRDGSNLLRLTDHPAGNYEPSVDPSGRQIAFISSRDGNAELYTMGADGSSAARRTDAWGDDMKPAWSPDGRTIAFLSMRDNGKRVYLMDADGQNQRPLRPPGEEVHEDAVWAPDSSALAVTVISGPNSVAVAIIRPDGAIETTFGAPDRVTYPAWSPDARWLALSVDGHDGAEVLIAARDGRTRTRITSAEGADWLPRWMADPRP